MRVRVLACACRSHLATSTVDCSDILRSTLCVVRSMDRRVFFSVFLAVLAAFLVHDVASALVARYYLRSALHEFGSALKEAMPPERVVRQVRYVQDPVQPDPWQRAQQEAATSLRTLLPTQRCVGHTVVDVRGSSFVQHLDTAGRPIACTGRVAAERVR